MLCIKLFFTFAFHNEKSNTIIYPNYTNGTNSVKGILRK